MSNGGKIFKVTIMSSGTLRLISIFCVVAAAFVWSQKPDKRMMFACAQAGSFPAEGVAACNELLEGGGFHANEHYQFRYWRYFGLHESGQVAFAIRELTELQNSDWDDRYRALLTGASALSDSQEYENSVELFERALDVLPESYPTERVANIWSQLAWRYEAAGRLSDAMVASETAMGIAPDYPYTVEINAWLHRKNGAYDIALPILIRALELGPTDDWAVGELPYLLSLMERQDDLDDILDQLTQANPDLKTLEYLFWLEMADEYTDVDDEDYEKTVGAFERGLALVPENASSQDVAGAWTRLSWRYQKLDRFEEAREAVQIAYEIASDHAYTLRHKSWLHRLDGEYEIGLGLIIRSLEIDPEHDRGIRALLYTLKQLDREDDVAQIHNTIVVEHTPDRASITEKWVDALEESGEYVQAAELLEAEFDLLQAEAKDERQLFMQLARMVNESGQAEARIAELTDQIDAEPGDRFALYLLGSLHSTREEFALSAFALQGLVRREPENAKAAGLFLVNCLGAGDDCPSLWPEKRGDRPEISCEDAIELSAVAEPGILEPLENGISLYEAMQDPDKSWIVAATSYTGATIAQIEVKQDNMITVAQAIILYDAIMGCYPGSEGTLVLQEQTRLQSAQEVGGKQVFFQDLYFHENLRQNRLDLAWEVKGYDLDFAPQPTQE
ncbi:tetratricopeptide repeat protein [Halocynthiibacter styelae]|uniref:Tetratricopeptide repeat protein n=1 Tax=Halocynthiibacter styelae TaxID=2761955 RepID=A0A8J7IDH1_9RHOB|nr:hypothetical protein [Paenihalocynthiibacter styelae]MBI1494443.1 hypothetical protein [Paenihalocynthiibacter styelae]